MPIFAPAPISVPCTVADRGQNLVREADNKPRLQSRIKSTTTVDKASLSALIEVSRAVGSNPDYVQAGGGNTSVKSSDGRTMAIKASGTPLRAMSESDGWVELDVAAVLNIFDRTDLPALPTSEREARVLQHLSSAVVGGSGRPSVESALHAMLGNSVIHTHAVAANALNCGPGLTALAEITPPDGLRPLWVSYTDPGWRLATAVKSAAEGYKKQNGSVASTIFLENHGLLVSDSTPAGCLALHTAWVARCERYFLSTDLTLEQAPSASAAPAQAVVAEVQRISSELRGTQAFVRVSQAPELATVASGEAAEILAAGALTPDHIVYTGAHAVLAESLEDLSGKLKTALLEKAPPRVVLVRGVGAFLVADHPAKLDAAEALAVAAAKIILLAARCGGAHNLSPAAADFIIHWEAEHYRAGLSQVPDGK